MSKKATLKERLGGEDALRAAVDLFYERLVADERLKPFFVSVNIKLLKWHQYNFMSIAFTEVPEDMDIPALIFAKHERLFQMGMNETHFDIVAGHFIETLKALGVAQPLIDEAVGVIAPLRPVFVEGAKEAQRKKKQKMLKVAGILVVVSGVVAIGVQSFMN